MPNHQLFINDLTLNIKGQILSDDLTTATLSSSDCEIVYSVTLPDSAGEGPVDFAPSGPSTCPAGTTAQAVADVLKDADYGLTISADEFSILQLWIGTESAALFATPDSGLDG